MSSPPYRHDIDCLRSFAVLIVILFHCGLTAFSGGFIGVDIFFVISGFVMYQSTSKIEISCPSSFAVFYKKRLFRIYPVLLLALSVTTLFSLMWSDIETLDYYGKQLFFSGFSLSNVLFAQGQNYFDSNTPLLLHTWSLGVEMQFYALFPFFMAMYHLISKRSKMIGLCFIALSLVIAFVYAQMHVTDKGAFFGLQNRAFEFLTGMLIAAIPIQKKDKTPPPVLPVLLVFGLILCAVFFGHKPNHPGVYTLVPIGLSMMIIALYSRYHFYHNTAVKGFSYMGRISYGIYLFHFPVSVFARDVFSLSPWGILAANILITLPFAHFSYQYFETPIRHYGYKKARPYFAISIIVLITFIISGFGYLTAKAQGWPQRLQFFNPYAYEVSQIHTQTKENYTRGIDVKAGDNSRILFIGDSLLQQYIDPIAMALGIPGDQVDAITRGGCVLLRGVDYEDVFADISCDDLREALYTLPLNYEYIVISQDWPEYQSSLRNATPIKSKHHYDYIAPFLQDTLSYLNKSSNAKIILLGVHPFIASATKITIGPQLDPKKYAAFKDSLEIKTPPEIVISNKALLDEMILNTNIEIIHPIDIFCPSQVDSCTLSQGEWSLFLDDTHLTKIGQNYAMKYFNHAINNKNGE